MRYFLGILCVLTAGVIFGFMPLFKRWISHGDPNLSTSMLLLMRFGIAAAALGVVICVRRLRMPRGKILVGYLAMGAVGYFGEAYCFFGALNHIPGAMVSLLLYTYPVFVTLGAWKLLGERITWKHLVAIAISLGGVVMTVVPSLLGVSSPLSPHANTLLGVALGLATAVSYGGYVLGGAWLSRRYEGSLQASTIVMASAAAMFAVVSLASGDALPHGAQAWWGVTALALFASVIAITALLIGLSIVGPVTTSAVSLIEPLSTIIVGATLMDEHLTRLQVIGGAFILLGAGFSIAAKPRENP